MVQMLDHFIPKGRTHVIEKTKGQTVSLPRSCFELLEKL